MAAVTFIVLSPLSAQQPVQADREPKTKLEAFQLQTGKVVIEGYSEIGYVGGPEAVKVNAMTFTDAMTGRTQSGVLIEVKESGRFENTDRSFIDYDEVDSLLKGLDYISKVTSDVTKLSQFEATYKTKGYFSATTFSRRSGEIEAAVKSGYIRAATAFLSLESLSDLRKLITEAKQKLDSVKTAQALHRIAVNPVPGEPYFTFFRIVIASSDEWPAPKNCRWNVQDSPEVEHENIGNDFSCGLLPGSNILSILLMYTECL